MKRWIFLPIILILGLLEVTFLDYVKIFGAKPDLLLVCVFIASLYFELKWVFIFSLFAGILRDSLAINMFGINTLLFSLWGFLIINLSKKITMESKPVRLVFIFIIALFNNMITRLMFLYLGNSIPLATFLRIAFLGSLYTVLGFLLVFKIVKPLFNDKK